MYPVTQVSIPKESCVALSNTVCCSSLYPLRGLHDKQACPTAWLGLASCLAFMYPSSTRNIKKNRLDRVGGGGNQSRGTNKVKKKAKESKKQSVDEGLEINNIRVHSRYRAHKRMNWNLMDWSYTRNLMQHWQWPPESLSAIRTGFGALIF